MATWESMEAFAFGDVQFLADGSIDAGDGGLLPQSARFDNLTVGDVTLNKPSGENGELISVDSPEVSVVARWDGHRWRVKKDSDVGDNGRPAAATPTRIPTALPGALVPEAYMHPQPYSPATQREPLSSNFSALIATAVAFLIMLVVTLVFLREPIASLMDSWHEEAVVRTLNNAVAADRDEAVIKLKALHTAAHQLSEHVEQVIGVSLERITDAPSDTPSEITEAIRKNDAFNDAWEDIRRVYPVAADFVSWQAALADVAARLTTKSARDSDRDTLQSLSDTFDQRSKALAALQNHVDVLGKILARRRTEKRFSIPERNPSP